VVQAGIANGLVTWQIFAILIAKSAHSWNVGRDDGFQCGYFATLFNTMLGLRRNTVQIVEHRSEWRSAFETEAAELLACVGDIVVDVQHIGSTAIAGVPAKPILDVAIAVAAREAIPTVVERICQRGYIDRGDAGSDGGYLLVKESEPDIRTVHLHIVEVTDSQWVDYLKFRETLRRDPNLRRRYAEVKRTLAGWCSGDRKAYTAGKAAFIREVLARAAK
jgi:GrpB-like predicted nucleotidyltransferase (UPF0157 family)